MGEKGINLDLRRALYKPAERESEGGQRWEEDPPYYVPGEAGSYDWYFSELLEQQGVRTFQEILEARKKVGETTHVLDLFGGGYFIDDLSIVDSITGVRLTNSSEALLQELEEYAETDQYQETSEYGKRKLTHAVNTLQRLKVFPDWGVVEGNVYRPSTWDKLRQHQHRKGIPSFDVIVAKPEAAFKDSELYDIKDWGDGSAGTKERYGRVMLRLLNRAYTSLSFNKGRLFSEAPILESQNFLGALKTIGERDSGLKVDITDSFGHGSRKNIAITKFPHSTTDLEGLVLANYKR